MNKSDFRKNVKKTRSFLFSSADEKRAADIQIFRHLTGCELLKNADIVLCYVSVRDEADTRMLLNFLLESGKRTAVPRCRENGKMDFFLINDTDSMVLSPYGIPEPEYSEDMIVNDFRGALCIVPGLAFDKNGKRIGYGAGYYDRYLENKDIVTAGLCYSQLLFDSVPSEAHDISVDYIITEKGFKEING